MLNQVHHEPEASKRQNPFISLYGRVVISPSSQISIYPENGSFPTIVEPEEWTRIQVWKNPKV
jgi:hypothetical protein